MTRLLALVNGNIITADDRMPKAEAVLVNANLISKVGSNEEIREAFGGGEPEIIDLEGKTVVPGFIDSHMHLMGTALGFSRIDLSGTNSLEEALDIIREGISDYKDGSWVLAVDFDESKWRENRYPEKKELDGLSKEHMIILRRICGHIAVANSKALERIDESWEKVDRDTGILLEDIVLNINRVVQPSFEEMYEGMKKAFAHAHSLGVTTVNDVTGMVHFKIYRELERKGEMNLRVHANLPSKYMDEVIKEGLGTPADSSDGSNGSNGNNSNDANDGNDGNDGRDINDHDTTILKFQGIKVFTDGSIGASTAALSKPYKSDENNCGMLLISDAELESLIEKAEIHNLQLMLHAIGDKAVLQVLNAFKKLGWKNRKRNPLRHRIEHMEVLDEDIIREIKELNLIASMQPNFAGNWSAPGGLNEQRLGKERLQMCNPYASVQRAGIVIAFGSDGMPFNPLYGIHSAVNHPVEEQRLSPTDALVMYTINGAYACFEEERKGSITPGKLADMVVLSDDLTAEENSERIKDIVVEMTILDGKIVFRK